MQGPGEGRHHRREAVPEARIKGLLTSLFTRLDAGRGGEGEVCDPGFIAPSPHGPHEGGRHHDPGEAVSEITGQGVGDEGRISLHVGKAVLLAAVRSQLHDGLELPLPALHDDAVIGAPVRVRETKGPVRQKGADRPQDPGRRLTDRERALECVDRPHRGDWRSRTLQIPRWIR
jgi:hypothetical protein